MDAEFVVNSWAVGLNNSRLAEPTEGAESRRGGSDGLFVRLSLFRSSRSPAPFTFTWAGSWGSVGTLTRTQGRAGVHK